MAKDIVETIPEAKGVDMMTIFVDPKATDGGISINDKTYIGEVTVPKYLAREITRIMQEYAETKAKLHDPSQKIRIKNSLVVERQYLADPSQHGDNKNFSMDFGLLDPWQWQFVAEPEKARLRKLKTSMYGYVPKN